VYSRRVDDKVLSFEHAKFLHQRSFVMFDRQTVSLWIHTTGEAVIGDYKGTTLEFLPCTVTTWSHWTKGHPKTLVLDVKKGNNAGFKLRKNPKSGGISVGQPSSDLKLYPLSKLQEKRLINDSLRDTPIVVVFDPEAFDFHAFERGDLVFRIDVDGKVVDQSGRKWNLSTGTSGEASLKSIPATPWLVNAWKRFYPEGSIYGNK